MKHPTFMILCLLFLLVLSCSPLLATVYLGQDDSLRIDFAPIDPLYKESIAYPFSNNVRFYYMIAPKTPENVVNSILVSADNGEGAPQYKELEFKGADTHNTKF